VKRLLLTLLICLSAGAVLAGNITIKGSDTIVRLGQRWAEEYMNLHKDVTIQVSGGGSGTGIAALLNGGTDICEASRDMKPQKYDAAKAKGIKPYRVSIALDGIAVYLNESNPVKELSLEQLRGIYTGSITDWKDVGGPSHLIILYGRENNSGTYAFFKEHVLKDDDYADATQTLPGTAAVVNAVAKDKYGIGYGGIAWAQGVKTVAVKKDESSPAIVPTTRPLPKGGNPISGDSIGSSKGAQTGNLRICLTGRCRLMARNWPRK